MSRAKQLLNAVSLRLSDTWNALKGKSPRMYVEYDDIAPDTLLAERVNDIDTTKLRPPANAVSAQFFVITDTAGPQRVGPRFVFGSGVYQNPDRDSENFAVLSGQHEGYPNHLRVESGYDCVISRETGAVIWPTYFVHAYARKAPKQSGHPEVA